MIGIESGKHFACAAFVRTTVVTIIPSPLQRLHGFGYNGIVRIHLSTWLVLQLEGSVHSVPRDVTLPSLDSSQPASGGSSLCCAGQRRRHAELTADCYSIAAADAALAAALLAYYTSSQVDALLGDRTGAAQDTQTQAAVTAAAGRRPVGRLPRGKRAGHADAGRLAGALLAYRTGPDQDVFTTSALVAYRSAADQDTATASSIAAALLRHYTIAQFGRFVGRQARRRGGSLCPANSRALSGRRRGQQVGLPVQPREARLAPAPPSARAGTMMAAIRTKFGRARALPLPRGTVVGIMAAYLLTAPSQQLADMPAPPPPNKAALQLVLRQQGAQLVDDGAQLVLVAQPPAAEKLHAHPHGCADEPQLTQVLICMCLPLMKTVSRAP